jgi:aspartate racemase
MRTLGIIGGIGPESTIEYYRQIIAAYRARAAGAYPSIVINSIDARRLLGGVGAGDLAGVRGYLSAEVGRLARAGADVALLASNTPHIVFDALARRSPVPLISIVEATCAAARQRGLRRLGLLGTRFTMQGRFYRDVFAGVGIALVVPDDEEQAYVHDRYMGELVEGVVLAETHRRVLAIIDAMRRRDAIDGIILGGTELSLLIRDEVVHGIPVLDTTRIHVRAAVDALLSA